MALSLRQLSHRAVEAALTEGDEGDVCCLLNSLIQLDADDDRSPWLRQAKGYHHADLAPFLTMGRKHATTVDRNVPIVAEVEDCVVQHAWKPRVILARGANAPILSDSDVGVVVHVHLKTQL
jgi:hypothetical protein